MLYRTASFIASGRIWSNSLQASSDGSAAREAFAFRTASGKWGFIDAKGEVVIPARYQGAKDFVGGLARVETADTAAVIDLKGNHRFTFAKTVRAMPAGTNRVWREARVTWRSGGWHEHWELLDGDGRRVVPPTYSDVRSFAGGRAAVNIGAVQMLGGLMGGSWGFIDESGAVSVPIEYEDIRDFSEGLALARHREATRYVDPLGELALDLGKLASGFANDFREGLASVVEYPRGVAGPARTRFIDKSGKSVLWVEGRADGFREGLSVVDHGVLGSGSTFGFIDRQGRSAFQAYFAEARSFSEGLAAATPQRSVAHRGERLWGYVDRTGTFRIPPAYNEAHPFQGGVAKVHVGGTWVQVSDAPSSWNGGEWWLIDHQGKRLALCD